MHTKARLQQLARQAHLAGVEPAMLGRHRHQHVVAIVLLQGTLCFHASSSEGSSNLTIGSYTQQEPMREDPHGMLRVQRDQLIQTTQSHLRFPDRLFVSHGTRNEPHGLYQSSLSRLSPGVHAQRPSCF
jgi:hypothetical protein